MKESFFGRKKMSSGGGKAVKASERHRRKIAGGLIFVFLKEQSFQKVTFL